MSGSVATPAFTGYSKLLLAYIPWATSPAEELDEPYRLLPVLRPLDDRRARDVDVLAGSVLIEELDPNCARPVLLLGLLLVGRHLADVVGVGERDVAHPFVDGLGLRAVVALGLAGKVGLHPLEPFLRRRFAVAGDDRRQ